MEDQNEKDNFFSAGVVVFDGDVVGGSRGEEEILQ